MRQARPQQEIQQEREWERWERERRRVLLMQYARSAVQIVAILAGTFLLIFLIVGAINEGI